SQVNGSGLGLAIAKAVVERHGGTLSLRASSADPAAPGLTVTLQWPLQNSA
ncbi:MAG TPA: ATP-binding protein, partial [Rhodoferax sp.]|nr:ATP-binding protein [Rhodoferax sp.]